MTTMNNLYAPKIAKNLLAKMPIAIPTDETFSRYVSLYSLIVGTCARIVQSSIDELYDKVSERKDLFRHSVKFHLNQAISMTDKLIKEFMGMATLNNGDVLWVDATSGIEHSVLGDINILFLTVDNILLKNNVKEDKIEAQTIVAYNLSAMALDIYDNFLNLADKHGVSFRCFGMEYRFGSKFHTITNSMHKVAEVLVSDPHADYLKEGGMIRRGLEIIALKISNIDKINEATSEVLERNGVTFDGETDNSYLPWNAIQENMVKKYFNSGDFTIEELAVMLGRSVGAIKTKAYKLGLTKKIS